MVMIMPMVTATLIHMVMGIPIIMGMITSTE